MEPNWDLLNQMERLKAPNHLRAAIEAKIAQKNKGSNTFNALMIAASITLIITLLNLSQQSSYSAMSETSSSISLIESQQLYYE